MARIPLTRLPTLLSDAGYSPPSYRRCYEMARSARLPVSHEDTGRWTFELQDLPAIVKLMGLKIWMGD